MDSARGPPGAPESVGEAAEERVSVIRSQVEYWFSRENLARDYFLVQHMDPSYYVRLEVLARVRVLGRCGDAVEARTLWARSAG